MIVIGSGMGGLACGALNAKYGKKTLVLESHIKPGGSAHTFSRMHNGGKYSFEVGPSIFEGLDKPSLNPLRIIIDALGEEMPVKTYTGLGYWTPQGYWRFPVGSKQAFEDLLMEQVRRAGRTRPRSPDRQPTRLPACQPTQTRPHPRPRTAPSPWRSGAPCKSGSRRSAARPSQSLC